METFRKILYCRFYQIKKRCYDVKDKAYKSYGGRGIKVCDEWLNDFQNFYDWAIQSGFSQELTLDRINNDDNYEPSNCRWVSMQTQANNRRTNVNISFGGKVMTQEQWAKKLSITSKALEYRLKQSLPLEEILVTKEEWTERKQKSDDGYSNGVYVTIDGKTLNLTEWAKIIGCSRTEIGRRYNKLQTQSISKEDFLKPCIRRKKRVKEEK